MSNAERIERKPEYGAEDWESVGKLKKYAEGQGFTFAEIANDIRLTDCSMRWKGSHSKPT